MNSIPEAWEVLRQEARSEQGWHVRRVFTGAPFDIFAGIHQPGSIPGLLIEVAVSDVPSGVALPRSRGFEVEPALLRGSAAGRVRFALVLSEHAYKAVFSVLCEDAARAALGESRPRSAVRAWLNRLHVWQEFMARYGSEGLSEQAALGLLGELIIMRDNVAPVVGSSAAVLAWAGPLGEPNDFAFPGGFLEVKTTSRQVPSLIEISDVNQLDDTRGVIMLAHVRLRPASEGETLPSVISDIRSMLAESSAERLHSFNDRLMSVGYIEAQADLYGHAYEIQGVDLYEVGGTFPRVQKSDLRVGVRSISYTIEVSACAQFAVQRPAILSIMKVNEHA